MACCSLIREQNCACLNFALCFAFLNRLQREISAPKYKLHIFYCLNWMIYSNHFACRPVQSRGPRLCPILLYLLSSCCGEQDGLYYHGSSWQCSMVQMCWFSIATALYLWIPLPCTVRHRLTAINYARSTGKTVTAVSGCTSPGSWRLKTGAHALRHTRKMTVRRYTYSNCDFSSKGTHQGFHS